MQETVKYMINNIAKSFDILATNLSV